MTGDAVEIAYVHVIEDGEESLLVAPVGANLRDLLRERGHSPYTRLTERVNCGGRGLCGSCGVGVREGLEPDHWHDILAGEWGYPRISCQITVEADTTVEIPEKIVWGRREPGWF
jgi:ferredoxin